MRYCGCLAMCECLCNECAHVDVEEWERRWERGRRACDATRVSGSQTPARLPGTPSPWFSLELEVTGAHVTHTSASLCQHTYFNVTSSTGIFIKRIVQHFWQMCLLLRSLMSFEWSFIPPSHQSLLYWGPEGLSKENGGEGCRFFSSSVSKVSCRSHKVSTKTANVFKAFKSVDWRWCCSNSGHFGIKHKMPSRIEDVTRVSLSHDLQKDKLSKCPELGFLS